MEVPMKRVLLVCMALGAILLFSCTQSDKPAHEGSGEGSRGEKLFATYCQGCHGPGAKGDIGPDLTDDEWRYGGSDDDIFTTISNGRPGGMPSWKNTLSKEDIQELIKYIRGLRR